MEGYGLILFFFILAFALFCLYFFLVNKNKKKIALQYNNSLKLTNAKCVLMLRYLEGIEELVENASCYLFADDEKLTITPLEYINTKIILSLSKINSFQYTNKVTSVMNIRQSTQNSITIRYLSNKDEINEIVFSTVLTVKEDLFDKYAISKCNLYKFVNERLPKQETTIEL